jgi:hypothetical protein
MNGQNPADGSLPSSRSPTAVKLDNLIRSKLRVNNPYDSMEIADGLQRFYTGAAQLTRLEDAGLPFYQVQVIEPPRRDVGGPSRAELDQAKSDVAKDLGSLLQKALLKDINPELRGWQSSIDNLIADGSEAAPLALDPRMRDRVFQARRLLGDYARIARFVGALTPAVNPDYRALAQSLDEVSSVFMVMMGDALANVGYNGGRFLLQASASDLQERRDAVLAALRNLVGSTQQAYGPGQDDWPRGLQAYQQFISRLDGTGNSDLRALFQEANLARLMDDLIARVNVMNADGLRALGSTAVLQVQPMRRLIRLGNFLVDPQSPPLASFLLALQLFAEAFQYASSGSRLIHIARPPILSYGLYGMSGPDNVTDRLNRLVVARGNLAVALDCFMPCECTADDIRCQIILDKLLYDIDRAIDALSLGSDPNGNSEADMRAAAYGLIIETLLLSTQNADAALTGLIAGIRTQLQSLHVPTDPRYLLLNSQLDDLVKVTAKFDDTSNRQQFDFNGCLRPTTGWNQQVTTALMSAAKALLSNLPGSPWPAVQVPDVPWMAVPSMPSRVTPVPTDNRTTLLQELCMQEDAESQWGNLLQTMAPSCYPASQYVGATMMLVELARAIHELPACGRIDDISIPADVATSLDGFVYGGRSQGGRVPRGP